MPIIFKIFIFFHVSLYGIGSQFLTLPFSSKQLSIGSHPTLFEHDPVNPSLYHAIQNQPSISFNQGSWFGGVGLTQAGYNFEKNDMITHFGFKYSGITDLEFRNDSPSDSPLSYFSSFGLSFDAGKAIIRDNQRYGISISYVHFGVFTYESRGLGFNFGYSRDLLKKIKVGAVIQNVGKMSKLQNDEILLPQRILVGCSKKFKFNQIKNSVYTSIEKNSLISSAKIHIGNHFNWTRFNLYSGVSSSKEVLESSFGFGFFLSRFEIAYGLRFGSQNIGIPQIITIRFLMI
tara:strand:+ start:17 stop:883 length:867 start_codon:yes stop_codon:yes gene_type:complete